MKPMERVPEGGAIRDSSLLSCEEYGKRMRDALGTVPGLELSEPEGAFYFFPRYDAEIGSVEMVGHLREHGVAVRPGAEFGPSGEGRLRLSYAASDEAILTGVERMAAALLALRSS